MLEKWFAPSSFQLLPNTDFHVLKTLV
jgi:hypothetical protein